MVEITVAFLTGLLFFSFIFLLIGFLWAINKILKGDFDISVENVKDFMFDGYYGVPLWMYLANSFSALILGLSGIIVIIYYCGFWILEVVKNI